jgi:acetyl esterase
MPLDPQAQAVLDSMPGGDLPDLSNVPVELMRQGFSAVGPDAPVEEVAKVENRQIAGAAGEIGARIYHPAGAADGPLPLLVYFHGGGFVLCDLDTHDGTCRSLANSAGCVVVSVDYRLAPEATFPAAPEDCYAATCWAVENAAAIGADPSRVAVAGDSAGGNLAAATTLMARDRKGPKIAHQLLIYPVTDYCFDTVSYKDNAEGYFLTRDMMKWFWGHYLEQESDGANPLASPLRAEDLGSLPPATVITAEFDPLRDEGEAYATRLQAAGVPTEVTRYDGLFHGFFGMGAAIDRAQDAVAQASKALRASFGS